MFTNSKGAILESLSTQESILIAYGVDPYNKKPQYNPINGGSDSFTVRLKGSYQLKDFTGEIDKAFNVIDLVMHKEGLTFGQAVSHILGDNQLTKQKVTPSKRTKAKDKAQYELNFSEFTNEELTFLSGQSGGIIKHEVITKYFTKLESFKQLNGNHEGINQQYIFAVRTGEGCKVYCPNPVYKIWGKLKQYSFNYPEDYFYQLGIDDTIKSGDPVIFIEGEKDFLTLKSLGYNSVCLGGVSFYTEERINKAKDLLKDYNIPSYYSLFDLDKAGEDRANKIKAFDVKALILPSKGSKDLSDYTRDNGLDSDLTSVLSSSKRIGSIKIDKYLGDKNTKQIVKDLEEYNEQMSYVLAPFGTGKTGIINGLKDSDKYNIHIISPTTILNAQTHKETGIRELNHTIKGNIREVAVNSKNTLTTLYSLKHKINRSGLPDMIVLDEGDVFFKSDNKAQQDILQELILGGVRVVILTATPINEINNLYPNIHSIKVSKNIKRGLKISFYDRADTSTNAIITRENKSPGLNIFRVQNHETNKAISSALGIGIISANTKGDDIQKDLLATGILKGNTLCTSYLDRGININNEGLIRFHVLDTCFSPSEIAQLVGRARKSDNIELIVYGTVKEEETFYRSFSDKLHCAIGMLEGIENVSSLPVNDTIARYCLNGFINPISLYATWYNDTLLKGSDIKALLLQELTINGYDIQSEHLGEYDSILPEEIDAVNGIKASKRADREYKAEVKKEVLTLLEKDTATLLQAVNFQFNNNKGLTDLITSTPDEITKNGLDLSINLNDYIDSKGRLFGEYKKILVKEVKEFCTLAMYELTPKQIVGVLDRNNSKIVLNRLERSTDLKCYNTQGMSYIESTRDATRTNYIKSLLAFKKSVNAQLKQGYKTIKLTPAEGSKSWNGTLIKYYGDSKPFGLTTKKNAIFYLDTLFNYKVSKCGNEITIIKALNYSKIDDILGANTPRTEFCEGGK